MRDPHAAESFRGSVVQLAAIFAADALCAIVAEQLEFLEAFVGVNDHRFGFETVELDAFERLGLSRAARPAKQLLVARAVEGF